MTPEKARSVSAGGTLGTDANVTMKTKLRTAEIEADRIGKELEIARWRLTVLEEDRITNEVEVSLVQLSPPLIVTDVVPP